MLFQKLQQALQKKQDTGEVKERPVLSAIKNALVPQETQNKSVFKQALSVAMAPQRLAEKVVKKGIETQGKVAEEVGKFAVSIPQAALRGGINLFQGTQNVLTNKPVGATMEVTRDTPLPELWKEVKTRFTAPTYTPVTKVEKALTGKKEDFSFKTAEKETKDLLTTIGVNEASAKKYAMPLVVVGSLADVNPFQSGTKTAITKIAKNTNKIDEIKGVLMSAFKFAKDDADELAPELLKITDEKTVKETVENFIQGKIKTQPTEIANDLHSWTVGGKEMPVNTVSYLKKNPIGADELPVDDSGMVTLYREGDVIPGKPQSFSLVRKGDNFVEVKVPKENVLVNYNSSQVDDLYNSSFTKEQIDAGYLGQRKLNKLESEVFAVAPTTKLPTELQSAVQTPVLDNVISQNLPYGGTVPPASDPVNQFLEALKKAPALRGKQEIMYTKERGQKLAEFLGRGKSVSGEAGFKSQKGALGGELSKLSFQPVRELMTQENVDAIFDTVKTSNKLGDWEKISAMDELTKIFNGQVPTRSGISKLSQVFGNDFVEEIVAKRSVIRKVGDSVLDVLNIPRAVMSGLDLSAPFRQGAFMIGRPKEFFGAFPTMFKSFGSKKAFEAANESIFRMPTYTKMRDAGLAIADVGDDIAQREEAFASRLVGKLPGVSGSSRAYTAFLNKLRADNFENIYTKFAELGVDVNDPTFLKSLGSFINSGTGRGGMPKALEGIAPILNSVFFSPRLMASRMNLLNPQFYIKQHPAVRKEMLRTGAKSAAILASVLGIAALGGAKVGTDPRNSDFAKIKVGNTRYDVSGGFQQYVKLMAQLISGKIVSSTTGRTLTLGEGYKPLTRGDIILRFFQNKESPIASFISSYITGEDAVGNKFELAPEVIDRLVPMMAQDIYDLTKERGTVGIPMALPGLFGVGSQTYGMQEVIKGKNKIGQEGVQISNQRGLGKTLSDKAKEKLLKKEATTGGTSTSNIETWYDQMLKLPKEEASRQFQAIKEVDPELAKRIVKVIKDRQEGITVDDKVLKTKGVQSGDRAIAIFKELDKLETKEQKSALWKEYTQKKIITPDVAEQLYILIKDSQQ